VEDMRKLLEDMESFFGVAMPSPINYPASFKFYMIMYKYHTGA
jgi:hypothetical protein